MFGMWSEFLLVRLSIWIACGLWFIGAWCRIVSSSHGNARTERVYRWTWFGAGVFTWVHVFSSYGLVHDWSHAAVLEQTGDDSYAVVGFRVPWGVYVNFLFAGILSGYSGWMIRKRGRVYGLDRLVYLFLAFIVFNALVVFKTGTIRWIGLAGFGLVAAMYWFRHRSTNETIATSESLSGGGPRNFLG
jgi:hypothetical protein